MKTIQVSQVAGEHPLDTVSRMVGGREILAKHLDVTVGAVGNWKVRGVPFEKCTAIEEFGKPAVTRRELRPTDWYVHWPELAQALANQPQPATHTVAQGA